MEGTSKIEGGTIVADVLSRWPQVAPVFLEHRMACIGCEMAIFETLADAADVYGLSLEQFIGELEVRRELDPALNGLANRYNW